MDFVFFNFPDITSFLALDAAILRCCPHSCSLALVGGLNGLVCLLLLVKERWRECSCYVLVLEAKGGWVC